MFLAPCTLPIVPGYLAFIAGVPAGEAGTQRSRRKLLANALGFVAGFSIVFILLGLFAASLGGMLGPHRDLLGRIAGAVIILFGLIMLGTLRIPGLSGEWHARLPRFLALGRWESSLVVGVLFAFGWSPCIGPILGTVLFVASTTATMLYGALLLAIFSLGLGIPFILVALLMERAGKTLSQAASLSRFLSIFGAVLLIALGLLMLTGNIGYLSAWIETALATFNYHLLLNYL